MLRIVDAVTRRFSTGKEIPTIVLMGEDLTIAVLALQRSSRAMPDDTETISSHAMRQMRETRLATRLRAAIARSL